MTMKETAAAKFVRPAAHRPLHTRLRIWARAVVDIALVLAWLPATLTGILLWDPAGFTPTGPGRGEREMLWGYTTHQWGDIHWWVCVAAVALTLAHIALDFKAFQGAMKYLVHAHGVPV